MIPNSLWVSGSLMVIDLVAGLAVGAGIVLEGGDHKTAKERLGARLVIAGVVVEAFVGVALFGFDTHESLKQQAEIVGEAGTINDQAGKLRQAAKDAGVAKGAADAAGAAAHDAMTNATAADTLAQGATTAASAAKTDAAAVAKEASELKSAITADQKRLSDAEDALFLAEANLRIRAGGVVFGSIPPSFPALNGAPVYILDAGDHDFATNLKHALTDAHISVTSGEYPPPTWHIQTYSGVTIVYIKGGGADNAALALCESLSKQNVDVQLPHLIQTPIQYTSKETMMSWLAPPDFPRTGLLVIVGHKLEYSGVGRTATGQRLVGPWPCHEG